jgi:signal transduction histidine kinase
VILADGQLLWRVFDNLLSNAVKYAMSGTRVYLDLAQDGGYAVLRLRNISKEELNVPVEDLLERFVRGDRSRHTEGSGLGLSIAQSLTELMGGELSLDIDGDLFKVSLRFPLYEKK